jgi:hypothetical protein
VFGDFNGLPVHALVLHVAVVFAPLAALVGFAYLVPKWRHVLRWPLVVVAGIATASVFVSKESGQDLRTALGSQLTSPGNLSGALIAHHAALANKLLIVLVVFLLLTVAAVVLHGRTSSRAVGAVSAVAVAVLAVAVLVLTYQTGEAGAKAVWNPAGSFDYSAGK